MGEGRGEREVGREGEGGREGWSVSATSTTYIHVHVPVAESGMESGGEGRGGREGEGIVRVECGGGVWLD